jgi:chromosome segregation ATPase
MINGARLQMEEVERARRARNEADQRFQDAQRAINEAKQAIVRHDRRSKELKAEIRAAQSTVDDLQDALDRDSVEEGKLDQLKANLEEAKSDYSITAGSYQEAVIAMDKYKVDMAKLSGEWKTIEERLKKARARVAKAKVTVDRMTNQRQAALQDKNSVYETLENAKDEKLQAEEARDKATKTIAEWSEKAAECGPRVPIDPMDTSVTLQTKYEKLSKDLRNYETKSVLPVTYESGQQIANLAIGWVVTKPRLRRIWLRRPRHTMRHSSGRQKRRSLRR